MKPKKRSPPPDAGNDYNPPGSGDSNQAGYNPPGSQPNRNVRDTMEAPFDDHSDDGPNPYDIEDLPTLSDIPDPGPVNDEPENVVEVGEAHKDEQDPNAGVT